MISSDNSILGTADVAALLGISTERVRQLERAGKLHAQKTPTGRRVFRFADVETLRTERLQQKTKAAGEVTD